MKLKDNFSKASELELTSILKDYNSFQDQYYFIYYEATKKITLLKAQEMGSDHVTTTAPQDVELSRW